MISDGKESAVNRALDNGGTVVELVPASELEALRNLSTEAACNLAVEQEQNDVLRLKLHELNTQLAETEAELKELQYRMRGLEK